MASTYLAIITTLALLSVAAPAQATVAFHAEGVFVAGSGVSYFFVDACGTGGMTEGVDSNCVALPAGLAGLTYAAQLTDASGLGEAAVCFYSTQDFLGCDTDVVPVGAESVSVTALVAAEASWTFDVFA